MSNNILFVFEGEKTEGQISSCLERHFFNSDSTIIRSIFGAEIYQLYKELVNDPDLDIFNLLKERHPKNKILQQFSRIDFAEIYLFFDYDGHSSLADDEKLRELLYFFNQETENGKLYISYPMVEALKHIEEIDYFKDLCVKCKTNIKYKNLVHARGLSHLHNFNKYDEIIWNQVILCHLKKMNFIVFDSYVFPQEIIIQSLIFIKQLDKFIKKEQKVAVLSGFPIFLFDYFGVIQMKNKLIIN